jgi:cellobiose-specific phosphotransferase system component IIA
MAQSKDIQIYKDYVNARATKKPVADVMKKHGVSRNQIYKALRRVQEGDTQKILRCLQNCRNECLWEHKYKARFICLPNDKTASTVDEVHDIIVAMHSDGIPQTLIAKKLGKARSTIIYHLETHDIHSTTVPGE